MNSVLITGASGFIGSTLVRKMLSASIAKELILLDKKPLPIELRTRTGDPNFLFIQQDLADLNGLIESLHVLRGKSVHVIHLAAQTSAQISMESPLLDIQSNLFGLSNLVESLEAQKVTISGFLFASSMAVYGKQLGTSSQGFSAANTKPNPVSVYGATKLFAEKLLTQKPFPVIIARLFNVYGPGQDMENLKQGMVSIYLAHLINEGEILVKGPVDRTRDFCYVDDVCEALINLLMDLDADGKIHGSAHVCNLGTGIPTSVDILTSLLISAFKQRTGREGSVKVVSETLGDMPYSFDADSNLCTHVKHVTSLEDGISKLFESLESKLF